MLRALYLKQNCFKLVSYNLVYNQNLCHNLLASLHSYHFYNSCHHHHKQWLFLIKMITYNRQISCQLLVMYIFNILTLSLPDRPTNQPTNQQTDLRGHREVTFLIFRFFDFRYYNFRKKTRMFLCVLIFLIFFYENAL